MLGKPFVHEREIGGQQFDHAPVLTQHGIQEQIGFLAECLPQAIVEIGEQQFVRLLRFDVAQIEPLLREVRHHRFRPVVGQHAMNLAIEHRRVFQLALRGPGEKLIIRNTAP